MAAGVTTRSMVGTDHSGAESESARVVLADSPDVTLFKGHWDITLLAAVLALSVLGLLLILSVTMHAPYDLSATERLSEFKTQLIATGIGIAMMFVMRHFNLRVLWRLSIAALVILLGILILMKMGILGKGHGGSNRWLFIGPLSIQPSEFAKVAWAIFLAGFLTKAEDVGASWKMLLLTVGLSAPFLGVLVLMKDVGSAVIMGATMFVMLLVVGINWKQALTLFGLGVAGLIGVFVWDPVKLARLLSWFFDDYLKNGVGFQVARGALSIQSGGLSGTGLGRGVVHAWSSLPEAKNDMIISVAAEELGFIGLVGICLLYAVIAYRGFAIARSFESRYRRNLAFLMTFLIILPAAMHMCVNAGIIPAKGLVAPFLSAGGTAMLISWVCVGILQRLNIEATARIVISEDFVDEYQAGTAEEPPREEPAPGLILEDTVGLEEEP